MELHIWFGVEGNHPIEWIIIFDKNLDGLKDTGLTWFEKKIKEELEKRGFLQSHVDTCVCYREEMTLLLYVDDCIIFMPSKDEIDDRYASLQNGFNI